MAIVQRFFSTAGAGAADGTSWANRAQLHNAGTWSTVITGFAFNGADSLQCFIGPGTYTISTNPLASGLFANPPTLANPLLLCGCDASGVLLAIPDPDWVSAQPAWSDSALPVLATTSNIATSSLANAAWTFIKFTSSARVGSVVSAGISFSWCVATNSVPNTSAVAIAAVGSVSNSVLSCTGSSYDTIASANAAVNYINTRIEGVAGSSGNRRGVSQGSNAVAVLTGCTIVNCGGEGFINTSTGTSSALRAYRCVVANNGATGLKAHSTASQTIAFVTQQCMVTGNGTAGIDGNSAAARWVVDNNRLRDNTTDITGLGNWPTDVDNYATAGTDAAEYVSTGANGDFRVRYPCAVWGKGFGVADQPEPAVGGMIGDGSSW